MFHNYICLLNQINRFIWSNAGNRCDQFLGDRVECVGCEECLIVRVWFLHQQECVIYRAIFPDRPDVADKYASRQK